MEDMTNRNIKIKQERESGATYRSLADKYKISAPRVRAIVLRQENKAESGYVTLEGDIVNPPIKLSTRARNCLYGERIYSVTSLLEYLNDSGDRYFRTLQKAPNIGRKTAKEILIALGFDQQAHKAKTKAEMSKEIDHLNDLVNSLRSELSKHK